MTKYFCNKKFRSLLLAGSITTVVQYLLMLSDTIVIGNFLGEQPLAAVNVVKPFFSFVIFVASLISIGTSVFYSYEIGRFNKDRADAMFGQGVIMALASGICMFLIGVAGKELYFDYMQLSPQTRSDASDYYFYYQFVIVLSPIYTVLLEVVYADGDELICNISSVIQIGVNIVFSIVLCMHIGIIGVGLGSALGVFASIVVLLIHFFRKNNSLSFVWYINGRDILKVFKCGLTDSSAYLCMGLTSFIASKFVIYQFGEYYLPVLLVVFDILELTIIFDGIGQAITPIVNVYRGECNNVGIRRVMKNALKYAMAEGIIMSVVLYLFGGKFAVMFGIDDAVLINISKVALRLVSPFFFCSGILFLQTTYYMIIEKIALSTAITGMKDWLIPSSLMCVFGLLFGINGVWIGLGVSPFIAVTLVAIFIYVRYGKEKFPLLLEKDDREVCIFDIELSQDSIIDMRDKVAGLLTEREIKHKSINEIMLFIEEVCMMIYEKNQGKKVSCECSVIIGDDVQIIIRDDGIISNVTDPDNQVVSLRSYVVAHMMNHIPNKKYLVTTGYNRNMFRFEK